MTHVILGLLMLWPQSLYELTKNFESGVSLFYSASTGSIKRALDRLRIDGYIDITAAEGPRGKKTYAITSTGREEFRRWMFVELTGGDVEMAVLPRAFFLGLIEEHDRPTVAANIHTRIQQDVDRLKRLEDRISNADIPDGYADIAKFQLATLQYGLAVGRTAIAWADKYLPRH